MQMNSATLMVCLYTDKFQFHVHSRLVGIISDVIVGNYPESIGSELAE
jgi:hypothetical protein